MRAQGGHAVHKYIMAKDIAKPTIMGLNILYMSLTMEASGDPNVIHKGSLQSQPRACHSDIPPPTTTNPTLMESDGQDAQRNPGNPKSEMNQGRNHQRTQIKIQSDRSRPAETRNQTVQTRQIQNPS